MGQRLSIRLLENGYIKLDTYYHWSGYLTDTCKLLCKLIDATRDIEEFSNKEDIRLREYISLMEVTNATLNSEELQKEYERPIHSIDRYNGLIHIAPDECEEGVVLFESFVEFNPIKETVNLFGSLFLEGDFRVNSSGEVQDEDLNIIDPEDIYEIDFDPYEDMSFDDFLIFAEEFINSSVSYIKYNNNIYSFN